MKTTPAIAVLAGVTAALSAASLIAATPAEVAHEE